MTNKNKTVPNQCTCSLIGDSLMHLFRICLKKIKVQKKRDTQQQIRINGLLVINLIHIRTAIGKLTSQPRDRFASLFHLLLDELTDMHIFFCHTLCHRFLRLATRLKSLGYIKKRRGNLLSCLSRLSGSRIAQLKG